MTKSWHVTSYDMHEHWRHSAPWKESDMETTRCVTPFNRKMSRTGKGIEMGYSGLSKSLGVGRDRCWVCFWVGGDNVQNLGGVGSDASLSEHTEGHWIACLKGASGLESALKKGHRDVTRADKTSGSFTRRLRRWGCVRPMRSVWRALGNPYDVWVVLHSSVLKK